MTSRRRAGGHQPAAVEQGHPVGVAGGEVEVVGDEQAGQPIAHQLAHQLDDFHLVPDVERRGRLVEHQRVGLLRQRAGHADPLPLAAGERLDQALPSVQASQRSRARRTASILRRHRRQGAEPGIPAEQDTVSSTVRGTQISSRCATTPTNRASSVRFHAEGSRPSTSACPASSGTIPSRARISVVLPQPLGPTSATSSPAPTPSDTSSSAGRRHRGSAP